MAEPTTETYKKDETFATIMTFAKFSIGLIAATAYGVDKFRKMPIAAAEAFGFPSSVTELAENKFTQVFEWFSYASYAIMVVEFFDPMFREEGKFLWIELKKDSHETRKNVVITIFIITALFMAAGWYVYGDKIAYLKKLAKGKKEDWKRPISLASNGFKFLGGIVQLITLTQNWDRYKNRKLFSFSSIALSLSAPVEMYDMGRLLYRAHPSGIVYISVYGVRTAVQVTQAIGLLTMEQA